MKKQISINNQLLTYTVRKSLRARRMRLAVHSDGTVVVTMPFRFTARLADKFVHEKHDWIVQKIEYFRQNRQPRTRVYTRKDYLKYREAARKFAYERVEHFNQTYNFKYQKISIRNQKTRWGSCSGKGNLNFNYKIIHLPMNIADYIIVHELCHLKEMNHSKKFWDLVSLSFPDHKGIRKELKRLSIDLS
ncbi:MAG: SprT family zinc-dependent metalloprotease [Patescibacteria group bacterium]